MKILILKPSSLGDVVHALPVLRLLKRQIPGSKIYWWLARDLLPLLEDDQDIAGLIPFERRRWSSPLNWLEIGESLGQMRRLQLDLVIDLQGLARSGAFAWLANGERLVGMADAREGATGFYDDVVTSPHTHAVDRYLSVLKYLGCAVDADFTWLPKHPAWAKLVEEELLWPKNPLIAICPGARWATKRWPVESFADTLAVIQAQRPDARFVVVGGRDDQASGAALSQRFPDLVQNVAGRTSLPKLIEWLRRCDVLLTNDTGPMHIAAAMDKPVVSLFGPTAPALTGPYGQEHLALQTDLPCQPCFRGDCRNAVKLACLHGLSPQLVGRQVVGRLSETGRAQRFVARRMAALAPLH